MKDLSPTQRSAILDYLDQPRRAREVADRIGRTVPHTSGVLTALVCSGRVVRLRHGIYVRADRAAMAGVQSGQSLLEAIMACCQTERSIEEIGNAVSRSSRRLRTTLNDMVRQGRLERVGQDGYRPSQPDLFVLIP